MKLVTLFALTLLIGCSGGGGGGDSADNATSTVSALEGTWKGANTTDCRYYDSQSYMRSVRITYSGNSETYEMNAYSDSSCTQFLKTHYRDTGSFTVSDGGELDGKTLIKILSNTEVVINEGYFGYELRTTYPVGTKISDNSTMYLEGDNLYYTDEISFSVNGNIEVNTPLTKINYGDGYHSIKEP